MLPLILTELGLPSTVMVTCWPEWLVLVRVSLACNLSPLTVCVQRAWKETKSPHGMPGVAVGVAVGVGVGVAPPPAGSLSRKTSCWDWPLIVTRPSSHEV